MTKLCDGQVVPEKTLKSPITGKSQFAKWPRNEFQILSFDVGDSNMMQNTNLFSQLEATNAHDLLKLTPRISLQIRGIYPFSLTYFLRLSYVITRPHRGFLCMALLGNFIEIHPIQSLILIGLNDLFIFVFMGFCKLVPSSNLVKTGILRVF